MEARKITRKQVEEEYEATMKEVGSAHDAALRKANAAFNVAAQRAQKIRRDGLRLAGKEAVA